MPKLSVNSDVNIHYIDSNPSGFPCVLLLHGLGVTGESWTFQIPPLTQAGFRVLAPDMRGFGKSGFSGDLSIANMAADMAALLTRLGSTPCIVIGISMGGTIAQELTLKHPKVVSKLVLVNTFASLKPKSVNLWLYYAVRFLLVYTLNLSTQAQFVARKIFPSTDQGELRKQLINQVKQANPAAYRAAMRSLARFNSLDRLMEISAPTLVITGLRDNTVPIETQQKLVERIPNCEHVYIENCGHGVPVERPDKFNQIILGFINQDKPIPTH